MIISYLDKDHLLLDYPYEDKYKCLTPIGGIWELVFQDSFFIGGKLIFNGNIVVQGYPD